MVRSKTALWSIFCKTSLFKYVQAFKHSSIIWFFFWGGGIGCLFSLYFWVATALFFRETNRLTSPEQAAAREIFNIVLHQSFVKSLHTSISVVSDLCSRFRQSPPEDADLTERNHAHILGCDGKRDVVGTSSLLVSILFSRSCYHRAQISGLLAKFPDFGGRNITIWNSTGILVPWK